MTSVFAAAGRRDPLAQHIHLVDTVAPIAPPPKAWTELRQRWDTFTDFTATPLRDRLIAAVVGGSGDLPMLRALANAEAAPERADVVIEVRAEVYPRLVAAYSEVAHSNYAAVGKEFDAAATEFTAAAAKCDPEADSDSIVGQPDPVRKGWLDSTVAATKLDRLVPLMCAAAELCGISTRDDTTLLPLLIDTAGLHRRRLWEAWQADGARTGRWGALAAMGARIRAADLEGFEPYRTPKRLIYKQFPAGGPDSRGIYKPVIIDPEDEDYTPPPEEPKQRRGRVAVR